MSRNRTTTDEVDSSGTREAITDLYRVLLEDANEIERQRMQGGVSQEAFETFASHLLTFRRALSVHAGDDDLLSKSWDARNLDWIEDYAGATITVEKPAPGHGSATITTERPAIHDVPVQQLLELWVELQHVARDLGYIKAGKGRRPFGRIGGEELWGDGDGE